MKKTALITGISGQDGSYLAKFLIGKKYTVIGTDRRSARKNDWRTKKLGIHDNIIFEEMELSEINQIIRILINTKLMKFIILPHNLLLPVLSKTLYIPVTSTLLVC